MERSGINRGFKKHLYSLESSGVSASLAGSPRRPAKIPSGPESGEPRTRPVIAQGSAYRAKLGTAELGRERESEGSTRSETPRGWARCKVIASPHAPLTRKFDYFVAHPPAVLETWVFKWTWAGSRISRWILHRSRPSCPGGCTTSETHGRAPTR